MFAILARRGLGFVEFIAGRYREHIVEVAGVVMQGVRIAGSNDDDTALPISSLGSRSFERVGDGG